MPFYESGNDACNYPTDKDSSSVDREMMSQAAYQDVLQRVHETCSTTWNINSTTVLKALTKIATDPQSS